MKPGPKIGSKWKKRFNLSKGQMGLRKVMCQYKQNAKNRGIEFLLTEQEVLSLTSSDCSYCGNKPMSKAIPNSSTLSEHGKIHGTYVYNGIDRIDNTKHYTIDNVITACKLCNQAKSNLSLDEFKTLVKNIYSKLIKEIGD